MPTPTSRDVLERLDALEATQRQLFEEHSRRLQEQIAQAMRDTANQIRVDLDASASARLDSALATFGAQLGRALMGDFSGAQPARDSSASEPSPPKQTPAFGRTTASLPWSERVLRQSLILDDITKRGGSVTKPLWYEIARYYGYEGRGLAGFFRGKGDGLLSFIDGDQVVVTDVGQRRMHENRERIALARRTCPVYGAEVLARL